MKKTIKKIFAVSLVATIMTSVFSIVSATEGKYNSEKLNSLSFVEGITIKQPFEQASALDCVVGKEDGVNIMYSTTTGKPGNLNIYDLDNMVLLRSYPLAGTSSVEHNIDKNGNVYIITSTPSYLFKYSPVTKSVENLGSVMGEGNGYQSAFDDEGNLYFGTYPNGYVIKYDPISKQMTNLGTANPGHQYTKSLSFYKGHLYAGTNGDGDAVLVKINPKTGSKKVIPVPIRSEYYTEVTNVYIQTVVGKYIVTYGAAGKGNNVWMIFDPEKDEYTDIVYKNAGGGMFTSPEKNGKAYLMFDGQIQELDLETLKTTPTGIMTTYTNRKSFWVDMNRNDGFGKDTLATVSHSGKPILLNINTKTVRTIEEAGDMKGGLLSMQHIKTGPDDKLYIGAYLGSKGLQYDTKTGEELYFPMGQTENIKEVNGKMYFGVYAGGDLYEMDPQMPVGKNNPRMLFRIGNDQDRPYIIDGGDGLVITGSVATYGKLGGALTIYNTKDGTHEVFRNVVKDQSIVGLAYKDGLIYGSTTTSGGLGFEEYPEKDAKVFVWDVAKKEKIMEFIPKWPEEITTNVNIIGDIEVGPDGLLWAAAGGYIFAMEPVTCKVVKSKFIAPYTFGGTGHAWQPRHLRFGENGLLYATIDYLTIIDPETMEFIDLKPYSGYKPNLMDIDSKGNIYFGNAADLIKIAATTNPVSETEKSDIYSKLSNTITMMIGQQNAIAKGDIAQIDPANETVRPIIKDGRTLLPVRFIAESLGAEVSWDETTRTVTLKLQSGIVKMQLGSDKMDVFGKEVKLDVPAQTINDRTMLPLRSLVEAIGKKVFWDDLGIIIVSDNDKILDNNADKTFISKIESYLTNYAPLDYLRKSKKDKQEQIIKEDLENSKNLIPVKNPGFEDENTGDEITGWSYTAALQDGLSVSVSKENPYGGNNSLYLEDNLTTGAMGVLSDAIKIEPNKTYTLKTSLYIQEGRTSVLLKYYDADLKELTSTSENVTTGQKQWNDIIVTAKAPEGAKYAKVMLGCSGGWITKSYYDNIRFSVQ